MTYPLQTLLTKMSGKSVTLGWDVVVAYDMNSVNTLFAQQYIQNVAANQHLPPISATIPIDGSSVSVEIVDLTLGPPLISFPESDGTTQEAVVTMNFIAGDLLVTEQSGKVQYVSAYQSIVPGDQYALTMTVLLQQATGEVDNTNVIVDLTNASSFKANLLDPGAASLLGDYFQTLFQNETQRTLTYQLGTLVIGTGDNLIPKMFDIRTQQSPSGGEDGAVLLFVATTYNPNGGNLPGETFPYLIPDGYSGALVVASSTMFSNIVAPYYQQTLVGSPTLAVGTLSGSSPASYVNFTGGSVQTPNPVYKIWTSGTTQHTAWSGTYPGALQKDMQPVTIPYNGLTIEPANDLMTISWSSHFGQNFGASTAVPRTEGFYSNDSVTLTVSASLTASASVSAGNVVSFAGSGTPSVTFQSSDWLSKWFGNGDLVNEAGQDIANAAQPVVQAVLNVSLPQVNTFAVSHLLFPSSNALQLTDVHVPGDLALFGAVTSAAGALTVTPLQTAIAWGQTQHFTASQQPQTWTRYPAIGSISTSGVYTAPTSGFTGPVVISAHSGTNVATAVVTIVSAPVAVSPAFSLVQPNPPPLQIVASTLGGTSPTWSIAPSDGSLGTIDQKGNYTAPAQFPSGINTAVVTATAGEQTASSLLCLFDADFAFSVTPACTATPLTAGQTQQFQSDLNNLTWSLAPQLGTISQTGLYTAPSSISAPTTVVVIVQDPADTDLAGFGVVMLTPTGDS